MWMHKESKWLVRGGRKVRCYLCGKKILKKDLFMFHENTGYYSHQSCMMETGTMDRNERRMAVKKIAMGAAVVGAIAAGAGKFIGVSSQSSQSGDSPAAQTILTPQGLILPALTSDPANPVPGQMWYRSDAGVMAHFDGVQNCVVYSSEINDGNVHVTSKGIVNGLSVLPNDGTGWFGPDTTLNATSPGQYGGTYTETLGLYEAFTYIIASGGGRVYLSGIFLLQNPVPTIDIKGLSLIIEGNGMNGNTSPLTGQNTSIYADFSISINLTSLFTFKSSITGNGVVWFNQINISSTSAVSPTWANYGVLIQLATDDDDSPQMFGLTNSQITNSYTGVWFNDYSSTGPTGPFFISNIETGYMTEFILLQDSKGGFITNSEFATTDYVINGVTNTQIAAEIVISNIRHSGKAVVATLQGNNTDTELNYCKIVITGSSLNVSRIIWDVSGFNILIDGIQIPYQTGLVYLVELGGSYNYVQVSNVSIAINASSAQTSYLVYSTSNSDFTPLTDSFIKLTNINFVLSTNNTWEIDNFTSSNTGNTILLEGVYPAFTPTLATNPPVSGTVYQNTNPYAIEIDLPVYATTSGTAGYVTIAKGSTDTPTAIGNQYVSGDTSSTATQIIRLRVPANWYYEFTGSGVTFGTASVFAD